jgi:phosphoserine phosphatase
MLDNDGTMWCERPRYTQHEFLIWAANDRVDSDPSFEPSPVLANLVAQRTPDIGSHSIADITSAMNSVFEGLTPPEFEALAQRFAQEWRHELTGTGPAGLRYQPMLELMDALRRRGFEVYMVTGGGIEFVRSFAPDFYGIAPERTVGSMVEYRYDNTRHELLRGSAIVGPPDEGVEKVTRIQQMLGRRPVFAAGNSAGDQQMLDYALSAHDHAMALLIDHDDDEREYAYKSVAASFADGEDIVEIGRRSGWTIASMSKDWATVFTGDFGTDGGTETA